MQKIDNDVVLLDAKTVEVLAHRAGQLVLALPPIFLASRNRGRV